MDSFFVDKGGRNTVKEDNQGKTFTLRCDSEGLEGPEELELW